MGNMFLFSVVMLMHTVELLYVEQILYVCAMAHQSHDASRCVQPVPPSLLCVFLFLLIFFGVAFYVGDGFSHQAFFARNAILG